jgi:dTDP-4-amino-4,6-dideoxygalactose transaminase
MNDDSARDCGDTPLGDLAAYGGAPFNRELIPLHRASIGAEELDELKNCLTSGWLTKGPMTAQFERDFATYLSRDRARYTAPASSRDDRATARDDRATARDANAIHALGLNSCTAALHTALIAAGIGAGDEVITTPMTFAATLNVIEHVGGTPVIVDIHPDTLCINEKLIESAVTPKTKAIIPVHYAGHPCEMDAIMRIAREHNLVVIEDCAHAVEAEYRGQPVGAFGDFGCFSFYATKNMTTGEGGMLVCKSRDALDRARVVSLHGMSLNAWRRYSGKGFNLYDIETPGFKYNMFDLQAALGLHQLKKIDGWWNSRKWLYERYCEMLEDLPGVEPLRVRPHVKSAYHLMVVKLDIEALAGLRHIYEASQLTPNNRSGAAVGGGSHDGETAEYADYSKSDAVRDAYSESSAARDAYSEASAVRDAFISLLLAENVQCYVHYKPIFEMSYYRDKYGWKPSDFPAAADAGTRIVTLPFFPTMGEEDVKGVVGAMRKVAGAAG